MGKRVFVDAKQGERCVAVVTLRDKSTAQCGRRAVCAGLCTQHGRMAGLAPVVESPSPQRSGIKRVEVTDVGSALQAVNILAGKVNEIIDRVNGGVIRDEWYNVRGERVNMQGAPRREG